MSPRLARFLIRLYSASWRRRYGGEFQAVLEARRLSARDILQVIGWAIRDRVSSALGCVDGVGGDLRYVLRSWRRTPLVVTTMIVTLVLSVGLTAGIMSFADGYLFRPLPFPAGEQLYTVRDPSARPSLLRSSDVYLLRRSTLASLGFVEWSLHPTGSVRLAGQEIDVRVYEVSPGFRTVVQLPLLAGRDFSESDHDGAQPVAAWLSYRFWNRAFQGDRSVLGRQIGLIQAGGPALLHIVGILGPEVASFDLNNPPPDIVVAAPRDRQLDPDPNRLAIPIVRLSTGMSREQGEAAIARVLQSLAPGSSGPRGVRLRSLRDDQVAGGKPTARIFLAAALLVLLLAAINLLHLLLTRGVSRGPEVATRAALGASQWRIVRLFLTESVLLCTIGIMAGLAVGAGFSKLISSYVPLYPTGPRNLSLVPVLFDTRVIGLAAVLGLLVVCLATACPVWRGVRRSMVWSQRGTAGWRSGVSTRAARVVLGAEVAVASMVLIGSTFIGIGVWRYLHQPLGFEIVDRVRVDIGVPARRDISSAQIQEALLAIRHLPGIAASGTYRPGAVQSSVVVAGRELSAEIVRGSRATPGYFEAWQLKMAQGRWFAASEHEDDFPVAVLDRTAAAALWPEDDPLGREIRVAGINRRIVGVVEPQRWSLSRELAGTVFVPAATPDAATDVQLVAWAPNARVESLRNSIRNVVLQVLPGGDISVSPITFNELYRREVGEAQFQAPVLAAFGLFAFLLAGVGVFGVASYLIAQRTHEFGVRLALGAVPREICRGIVLASTLTALAGLAVGTFAAWMLESLLVTTMFGWESSGPWALFIVAITLLIATVLATAIPARRIMRIDPAAVLRAE